MLHYVLHFSKSTQPSHSHSSKDNGGCNHDLIHKEMRERMKGHPCLAHVWCNNFLMTVSSEIFGVKIPKKGEGREFVNEYKKIYLSSADWDMWGVQILQRKNDLGVDPKKMWTSNK